MQYHCASAEEGWHLTILHRLLAIEHQDEERLIPDTERSRDNGILSGHQILLHHGPQERVLAGEDVSEVPPVHGIHCGKHGHVRVSQNALWLVQCASNVSAPYAKLSQRAELSSSTPGHRKTT